MRPFSRLDVPIVGDYARPHRVALGNLDRCKHGERNTIPPATIFSASSPQATARRVRLKYMGMGEKWDIP